MVKPEVFSWDEKGLSQGEANRTISTSPSHLEALIGTRAACIDPALRRGVLHLAGLGYNPQDSCQGHGWTDDAAHISVGRSLPPESIAHFRKAGWQIESTGPLTSVICARVMLIIPHGDRSPKQFERYVATVTRRAPRISPSILSIDEAPELFRQRHHIEIDKPKRYHSHGWDPFFERLAQVIRKKPPKIAEKLWVQIQKP